MLSFSHGVRRARKHETRAPMQRRRRTIFPALVKASLTDTLFTCKLNMHEIGLRETAHVRMQYGTGFIV